MPGPPRQASVLPDARKELTPKFDGQKFKSTRRVSSVNRAVMKNPHPEHTFFGWASDFLTLYLLDECGLDYTGVPLYMELTYAPAIRTSTELMQQYWGRFYFKNRDLAKLVSSISRGTLRSVYIAAECAHLYGPIIGNLPFRVECVKALVVAMHGKRNPRLCSCCANTLTGTVTSNKVHVMHPFWECISIPDQMHGACANCIWRKAGHKCEWRKYLGYQTTPNGAMGDHSLAGAHVGSVLPLAPLPEVLTQETAPRVCPWIFREEREELKKMVVERQLGLPTE